MWKRLILFVVATSVCLAAFGGVASAHSGEESHVYLQVYDSSIEGRVEYPIADFNEIFGVELPDDPEAVVGEIEELVPQVQSYTEDHFWLGDSSGQWPLVFEGYEILETGSGLYLLFPFEVGVDFANEVPREFNVFYEAIIESKPERSAFLIIENDWRSGTFRNEGTPLLRFTSEQSSKLVSLDEESAVTAFTAVVGLGAEHIQIGSDHILFILALVLPSVLIFSAARGWQPAGSFGSSLWRVTKIATSFTIAHTITLTLGGLGIVEISPAVVEPIIAISIALAAWHNLKPVFFNNEWLIAFVFGLFHGFGFAGLLGDLGLDRSNRVISLLGFNLGIELGQVAIILLLFPALFLLRRVRVYVPFMKIASGALILIALGWFADRVFGLDLGVDSVVDVFLAWPRPIWVVIAFTLFAVAYYRFEEMAGRLIPLEEPSGGPEARETISV